MACLGKMFGYMVGELPSSLSLEKIMRQLPKPQSFISADAPESIRGRVGIIVGDANDPLIWTGNIKGFSLINERSREELARYLTRLAVDSNTEIALGLGINQNKSEFWAGKVTTVSLSPGAEEYGIFTSQSKWHWLSFKLRANRPLISELDLKAQLKSRKIPPSRFDQTFEKIKASLPALR